MKYTHGFSARPSNEAKAGSPAADRCRHQHVAIAP